MAGNAGRGWRRNAAPVVLAAVAAAGCTRAAPERDWEPAPAVTPAAEKQPPEAAARPQDLPQFRTEPARFQVEETTLWDGRPSLGGAWAAHPSVEGQLMVEAENLDDGRRIRLPALRLLQRAGRPTLQLSAEAARALAMRPGRPTRIRLTALVPSTAPTPPARGEDAPAEIMPAVETFEIAAAETPAETLAAEAAPEAAAAAQPTPAAESETAAETTAETGTETAAQTAAAPASAPSAPGATASPAPSDTALDPRIAAAVGAAAAGAAAEETPAAPPMDPEGAAAATSAPATATAHKGTPTAAAQPAPAPAPAPVAEAQAAAEAQTPALPEAPAAAPAPALRPAAAPASASASAPPATPARASGDVPALYVQIGAFGRPDNAAGAAARFRALGQPVETVPAGRLQRILLGPFASIGAAQAALDVARAQGFADAYMAAR